MDSGSRFKTKLVPSSSFDKHDSMRLGLPPTSCASSFVTTASSGFQFQAKCSLRWKSKCPVPLPLLPRIEIVSLLFSVKRTSTPPSPLFSNSQASWIWWLVSHVTTIESPQVSASRQASGNNAAKYWILRSWSCSKESIRWMYRHRLRKSWCQDIQVSSPQMAPLFWGILSNSLSP